MDLPQPLLEGCLLRRYKRFLADVELADGSVITAHTPNTGSMRQCAEPGVKVMLSLSDKPQRKYRYGWELVEVDGRWVDINTQRANRVVEEALAGGAVRGLKGYKLRREFAFADSRIDFMLEQGATRVLLEVKNVTLCCAPGVACFPDAVTLRGQKHLRELARAVGQGWRAVIFFLVQRSEAHSFTPADAIDPAYGRLLREVAAAGVEVMAYRTAVSPTASTVAQALPVVL